MEPQAFVPPSLLSLRRTSTGSLASLKKQSNHQECNSTYRHPSQHRHNPIAGGSWDDNSVGHGTVAARMRRERNRAIRQTKSPSSYTSHAFNTHAHITSTLNLINTTALSPWQQHDPLPWDDGYDLSSHATAATKRSAGSLFNIPSTCAPSSWDARSIPEHAKVRPHRRTPYRHSYTSAYHHSSPASGCPSMAGSDIDSSDLAFFSMTDDSSLFDGDSLFSDSYGVLECDSGFSTNIFNLLEEGTISCRTPFLNADWTDSVSELDFDCSEQPNGDISNCDAKSDIGPSCSAPDERNRLKKRQVRVHEETKEILVENHQTRISLPDSLLVPTHDHQLSDPVLEASSSIENDFTTPVHGSPLVDVDSFLQQNVDVDSFLSTPTSEVKLEVGSTLSQSESGVPVESGHRTIPQQELRIELQNGYNTISQPNVTVGLESGNSSQHDLLVVLDPRHSAVSHRNVRLGAETKQNSISPNEFVMVLDPSRTSAPSHNLRLGLQSGPCTNHKVTTENEPGPNAFPQRELRLELSFGHSTTPLSSVASEASFHEQTTPMQLDEAVSRSCASESIERVSGVEEKVSLEQTLASNLKEWNNLPKAVKLGLVEQLSNKISKTMGLQEQLDIIHILGVNNHPPFHMSIDDIDSHKLSRVLGYLDSHKVSTPDSTTPSTGESGLRRSNSDGNIAKSVSEAQKEHRRRQRQARRFAKWLKQRQRKENRQQLKEQRSGLFLNEEKVKIERESEEVEIDV